VSGEYEPGACNIGRTERRVRFGVGAAGFLVAAAFVVAVPVLSLPRWALLLASVPLFGGFVGYFQGRAGFCVRYAMAGVYNVGEGIGKRERVADPEAIRRDRGTARALLARSAVSAGVLTLVV
jgi:hypothetical protein